MKVILASGSPRRRELFAKLCIPFETIASAYEEDMTLPLPPKKLAEELALGKARDVAAAHPEAVVVGADTFVVYENDVLGKPHTAERARTMLQALSNKWVSVITGIAVVGDGKEETKSFASRVLLKQLSDDEIDAYVATGEPLDKAGAFAIQEKGGAHIAQYEGDFDTIVGLPVRELQMMLAPYIG